MKKKHLYFVGIFLILLPSLTHCKKEEKRNRGGVVLTFDDRFVKEWLYANYILRKYDWKATFCLSQIDGIPQNELDQLKKMEYIGHEIACHGMKHLNASAYVKKNGINDYVEKEINPILGIMDQEFHSVTSFAYPYGQRSLEIDSALFEKFQILRSTTLPTKDISKAKCFYQGNKLVYAITIDYQETFNQDYITKLLEYARDHDLILVLYAHKPVFKNPALGQVDMTFLESICKFIDQNNMRFYTLSDLASM